MTEGDRSDEKTGDESEARHIEGEMSREWNDRAKAELGKENKLRSHQ